jgi:hypothetical protein
MNCNCIKTLESQVAGKSFDGRKVIEGKIPVCFVGMKLQVCTYTEMETKLEGLKNPKQVKIMHSYCPFCGKKISLKKSK